MKTYKKIIIGAISLASLVGITAFAAGAPALPVRAITPVQAVISDSTVATSINSTTVQVVETKQINKTVYVAGLNNEIKGENAQIAALQAEVAKQQSEISAVQ